MAFIYNYFIILSKLSKWFIILSFLSDVDNFLLFKSDKYVVICYLT